MDDRKRIEAYLSLVKKALSTGGLLIFANREKNLAFIKRHGLTIAEIRECILCLSLSNYCNGPLYDNSGDNRHDVWIFGTKLGDVEVYIKLSFGNSINTIICISFHEAERVMLYPFGGEHENN